MSTRRQGRLLDQANVSSFSDAGYLVPRLRLLGDNLLQLLRLPLRPTPWYYGRSRMKWRILV
jgi:hypothetical protein